MPIASRLAVMTSRAWGQFKATAAGLVGNYLYSWGANGSGRLGIGLITGTAVARSSPVAVALRKTFVTGNCYSHAMAITSTGELWGWGTNTNGALGDGTTTTRNSPVQIGTLTDWSKVNTGLGNYTQAIKTDGTLWGWGVNTTGQLGTNNTTAYSSPVQIGTLTNWSKIDGQSSTSVAIKTDGTLWAWGGNSNGQIGDGTTVNKSSPIQIGTLATWSEASSGSNTSAAIKNNGSLWTWGLGNTGQLGSGATTARSSPVQVGTLTNWSKIAAGSSHFIALKTDGTLWAWGSNANGTLGDGTTTNQSSPIQIGTLNTWTDISVKNVSCAARRSDGTIWAWGSGGAGQFGDNAALAYSSPIQIGTKSNCTFVAMGVQTSLFWTSDGYNWSGGFSAGASAQLGATNFSSPIQVDLGTRKYASVAGLAGTMVAVSTDKKLWGWGLNSVGQIGDGTTIDRSLPTQVGTLTNWKSVYSIGSNQSTPVAIKTDNSLWSWGDNTNGELGNNTWGTSDQDLQIPTPFTSATYSDVSYGTGGLYVSGGALYGCGNNYYYELGDGTTVWKSSPVQIGTLTNWSKVFSGRGFSLSIKTDGTLWAWGINAGYVHGPSATNLANTAAYSSPIQIALSYGALANSSYSRYDTHALTQEGYLVGWGRNVYGQVGNSTTTGVSGPLIVDTNIWSAISDGDGTSTGIKSNGTLWGWGTNYYGELGAGFVVSTTYTSPIQMGTLSNWSKVSAGGITNYYLNTSGQLYAAGANQAGQIGDGTTVDKSSLTQIGTLTTWSKVSSNYSFASAIKNDGSLWMWGLNSNGQLGDGTTVNKSSPIQVGTLTNWSVVSCGLNSVLAVKTDGTLWAWGYNADGQLGDGTVVSKSSPIQIGTLTTWSKASTAGQSSIVLRSNGTVWSWGNNSVGQLGLGDVTNRSSPVQVGTLTNWSDLVCIGIGTSYTKSYFKNSDNQVWTCGDSAAGSGTPPYYVLGVGVPSPVPVPIQVGTVTTWSDAAPSLGYSNDGYVLLKRTNNSLWSAGDNAYGQLGQNDTNANYVIRQVGTLTNWSKVIAGGYASLSIKTDGTLWAWGSNGNGQLGDGTITAKSSPIQIGTLTNWSYMKSSSSNSAGSLSAVKTDGTLWSWGYNTNGELGLNDTTNRSSPTQVGTLSNWAYSFNDYGNSFFVKTDNTLWGTGLNSGTFGTGLLGDGTTVNKSSPVQIDTGYSGLISGSYLNYGVRVAQKTNNTIASWGHGFSGPSDVSYGVPPSYVIAGSTSSPVQVGTLTNWSSNKVKTDGTLWGWGLNSSGQIGVGDVATRLSPTQVGTLTNWAYAQTSNSLTGAVKTNGTLWAWGAGGNGGIGNSSTANQSSPVQIGTLTNWSKLAVGNGWMIAVKTDGTLWSWGLNSSGQLGSGTTTNRSSPVQVGTLTTWANVFIAGVTSYASKTDGTLWAWGLGTSGQLGDGTSTTKSSPVQIGTLSNWASGVNFTSSATSGAGTATS